MKFTKSRWFALAIVLSAPLLSVIDVFIINIAIPSIRSGLNASEAEIQLVIAGYLLGYAAFLITGGRLGDHFGKKKVFTWGMSLFTLSSCWCGLSHSPLELNIARFFQGVSASLMVPQTISYIQVLFIEPKDRAKAVGWFGFTLGLASIMGQFLGGLLTSGYYFIPGWRLIFFINLPIGIVAIWMAQRFLKETSVDSSKKFDVPGVLLLTTALFALIIPLIQGREYGWPWWSFMVLILSVVLFIIFFRDQTRKRAGGKSPLIDIHLFSLRDFNIGLFCVLCYFVVHNSYLLVTTLLFQNGFHFDSFLTGKLFVLFGAGVTVSSLYSIRLISRFGKKVVQGGVLIMFVAICLQVFLFSNDTVSLSIIATLLIFHGLGLGLVLPSLLNVTLRNVPTELAGAASGVYSSFQQVASALGISVIGGLFFTSLHHNTDIHHYQNAFRYAVFADLGILLIMSCLLFVLPGGRPTVVHLTE